MTLRQFLLALRARSGVFLVAVVAVVLAAVVASLLLPKSYRATAALLVDVRDAQSMADQLHGLVLPQEHQSYLQTQADILGSPKVAHRVVEQLKLAQSPATLATLGLKPGDEAAGGRVEDQLVEVLLHNLKVETSQSNVIQATFTSTDPRLAASIANGFATAYVDEMLELHVAPTREAAAWFGQQLQTLRASLEDAQQRLRADVKSRRAEVAQHPEGLAEIRDSAYIQQLRADLSRGEAKLQVLSTQYGVNYPDYQRQLSENEALRERLQAEMRRIVTATANSGAGELVRPAPGQPPTDPLAPALAHNVESAERAYDAALQHYYDSQVESRASQTDVTVLSLAAVPLRPFRPNIVLNVALALVMGLALGAALVALSERQDARVRSVADLTAVIPLPLLAVLSSEGTRSGLLPRPAAGDLRALPRPG